jgi:hypothetical protein
VSAARDLYLAAQRSGVLFRPGDEEAYQTLGEAAKLWSADGRHFSAGYAMSWAARAAWGNPEAMMAAQRTAVGHYMRAIHTNPPETLEALAALHKLRGELSDASLLFGARAERFRSASKEIDGELAQRILTFYTDSPHAENFLVRGIQLSTNLDGIWEPLFPEYEVALGTESFGERIVLNLPSAFHLLIRIGDYQSADAIARALPQALTSHGLRGWAAVAASFVDREHAVEWLDRAADLFAEDTLPGDDPELARLEMEKRGGYWSGINAMLWTKYFRARARVLEAIRDPSRVRELIGAAGVALQGTESGFVAGEASRLRIIVGVLTNLLADAPSLNAEGARQKYLLYTSISGEDQNDEAALEFLQRAAEAFSGFRTDPATELTNDNLSSALAALARLPLIGPEVAEALRPALGASALNQALGPVRTWVHRTLQGITDEAQLRHLLLRLLQASLPRYAQIRHGPIEFGKDLAVVVEEGGRQILRMYQVKCGEIDKKKWRESRDELEEMFQVPLPVFQLAVVPDVREGVLVATGHANPYVEPVMNAWFAEERETFGRRISFMHLDDLVGWIFRERLISEFKAALSELGIGLIIEGQM